MTWTIARTDSFLEALEDFRSNVALLKALQKKLDRLAEDPVSVGGKLSGPLHGWQSTRLAKNFRLLFKVEPKSRTVFLGAIDHRKDVYG